MENTQKLYSLIISFSIIILFTISLLLYVIYNEFKENYHIFSNIRENWLLESIFIISPFIIVLFLMFPSFAVLYNLSEIHETTTTVKVVAHQWYWSYEVTGFPLLENDISYWKTPADIPQSDFDFDNGESSNGKENPKQSSTTSVGTLITIFIIALAFVVIITGGN